MPSSNDNFTISQTIHGKPPRLPYVYIKNKILGKQYALSLVFVGDARSQKLNKIYRKKNTPANVLSFPLSKNEGEIFINPQQAKIDALNIEYLFIHGLLHLKGYSHGSTMEREEKKLLRLLLFYGKKHINRNRYRNLPSKSGGC